ncbi:MAG: hypothetical protein F8N36_14170 [Desulfovibrio sp.]|uniref:hypothetical protein n=1 Tax=Desulfovibrio sp. TaxID=885 RepID=UPI00135E02D4|nr:hypothetical protein [Desulfovibrio sp.]MTJ93985.1 hypothetical protein [Desulfovibrio sp.]
MKRQPSGKINSAKPATKADALYFIDQLAKKDGGRQPVAPPGSPSAAAEAMAAQLGWIDRPTKELIVLTRAGREAVATR